MIEKLFRKIGSFKGKQRLARLLLKKKIYNGRDILIKGLYDCVYKLPNINENIGFEIFINGIYEKETINLLNELLPRNGHFLDVGANIGSILIPLCTQRPDIRAIAVEAAPWIFKYLKNNADLNCLKNVILLNYALLDIDNAEIDFFAPEDKFGKGSLSPVFTKLSEKVKSRTIDSILDEFNFHSIDFIKIDVEGYEYFVFNGAETLLKSENAPFILLEFVDWAENSIKDIKSGFAQEYLLSLNYRLFTLTQKKIIELKKPVLLGSYNILAVPPNRHFQPES